MLAHLVKAVTEFKLDRATVENINIYCSPPQWLVQQDNEVLGTITTPLPTPSAFNTPQSSSSSNVVMSEASNSGKGAPVLKNQRTMKDLRRKVIGTQKLIQAFKSVKL